MSYPLYADLYEANGAIYRRPPYRGDTTQMNSLPAGGDTADLYDDDYYEEDSTQNDDGPVCGVGSIPGDAEIVKPERAKQAKSIAPPPGLGHPAKLSDMLSATKISNGVATDDPRVTKEGDRRWTASIDVPTNLHGILIGQQHATRREMEDATQCRIIFPKREDNSTQIRIVSAVGQENVSRCLDRIEAVIHSREKSGRIQKESTHFAAIPCTDPFVQQRFVTFQDMVMRSVDNSHPTCKIPALFPSKLKLHVTVCMLQLLSDQEKEHAAEIMSILKERFSARPPLEITIEGLDTMTDNPAQVHVLFAKIHGEGVQEMIDEIKDEFANAGLCSKREHGSVKLHMTVMNSRYAAKEVGDEKSRSNYVHRTPFDATALLREHGDFDFGKFTLDHINICTLHTEDEKTGYYECFADEKIY